jgi:hypothetical protein
MAVNYSIVQSDEGAIAVQSVVRSFNLDHVTEKDITSFYTRFSQFSAWDTGLLPVDGTGTLSIRTAGEYTQFAYQHKPGLHHINWGKSEGAAAAAYYLAQPYRIIICDMKDGNLLGARMFYSPYPITTPSQPLYHVNLPNINCKGYRGNGVGWICLYQNEDWTELPLNERIVRFIERCSGVETYNDANMSETDGTRFYQEHNKPNYFWDPVQWEQKSSEEGFEWTLDDDLLIPVLVKSMDDQSKHVNGGVPLTFADALVGDYQAYYYDTEHTKPINAIIRPDKELNSHKVLSYFASSYNAASNQNHLLNNTFQSSEDLKQKVGSLEFTSSPLTNAPAAHGSSESLKLCSCCEEEHGEDDISGDYYGNNVCSNCLDDHYVYIEAADSYFSNEDENIIYIDKYNSSYHAEYDSIECCENCDEQYAGGGKDNYVSKVVCLENNDNVCPECIHSYVYNKGLEIDNCAICSKELIASLTPGVKVPDLVVPFFDYLLNEASSNISSTILCSSCQPKVFICPCGMMKDKTEEGFNHCSPTTTDGPNSVTINKACASCVNITFDENQNIQSSFVPISLNTFTKFQSELSEITSVHQGFYKSVDEEPF